MLTLKKIIVIVIVFAAIGGSQILENGHGLI